MPLIAPNNTWRWIDFQTTGTNNWVVPVGVYQVFVTLIGGGGGGGNGSGGGWNSGAGGSSAWSIFRYPVAVTPGETLTFFVGLGGVAGSNGQNSYLSISSNRLISALGGFSGGNGGTTSGSLGGGGGAGGPGKTGAGGVPGAGGPGVVNNYGAGGTNANGGAAANIGSGDVLIFTGAGGGSSGMQGGVHPLGNWNGARGGAGVGDMALTATGNRGWGAGGNGGNSNSPTTGGSGAQGYARVEWQV